LEEEQAAAPPPFTLQVYVAAIGEAGQHAALPLTQQLRSVGIATGIGTPGRSLKTQLRAANEAGSRYALVLGDDEVRDGTVQLKDLAERRDSVIPVAEALSRLQERLRP
jgi:histidyl-tRNA synthetase